MPQEFPPLFLGTRQGIPYTVPLERHGLTIAGTRAGKGVAQITNTLSGPHAWQGSAVVIDPKGEAARRTWEFRRDELGQEVVVFDPFAYAKVPPELRKTFNPLAVVDSLEGINTVADGLVIQEDGEKDPHWPESARLLFKGACALVISSPAIPPDQKNLVTVARLLRDLQDQTPADPNDPKAGTVAARAVAALRACPAFGGIAQDAAAMISDSNETGSFFKNFTRQRQWLASPEMQAFLSGPSSVDLHQLKHGKMTVYLVIPPDHLKEYRRFLRLFVALTQSVMWRLMPDGSELGTRCLFLLDEFPALGRLDKLLFEGLPLGGSFGLHVWPFCQYYGQLVDVYGESGAQAFTGCADAVCLFGVDFETAEHFARQLGDTVADDVEPESLLNSAMAARDDPMAQTRGQLLHATISRPRLPPEKLRALLAKDDGQSAPRHMLVILRSGRGLLVEPFPYFNPPPSLTNAKSWLRLDRFLYGAGLPFVAFLASDMAGFRIPYLPEIWFGLACLWGLVVLLTHQTVRETQ